MLEMEFFVRIRCLTVIIIYVQNVETLEYVVYESLKILCRISLAVENAQKFIVPESQRKLNFFHTSYY